MTAIERSIFGDIEAGEKLFAVAGQANTLFPTERHPHRSSVWRAVQHGTTVGGVVIKLEAVRTPRGLATTRSAVHRYLSRMTANVTIEQETVERIRPRALVRRTRGSDERLEKIGF